MFTRIISLFQSRRATAFLLTRGDDHLLRDIGLTRDDLTALHHGTDLSMVEASLAAFHSIPLRRTLPAAV